MLEILAAIGVVLPTLTGIVPWLTPVAAIGVVLLTLGAAWVNFRARLYQPIAANFILIILAVVLAYGRFAIVGA